MVDYANGLKRPFTDITTLIIGTIIVFLPFLGVALNNALLSIVFAIVSMLIMPGYYVKNAKKTIHGDNSLQKFDDIFGLIILSIKNIIVDIVYLIPFLIILIALLLGSGALMSGMFAGVRGSINYSYGMLGSMFAALGFVFIIILLLGLFWMLIILSATMHLAKNESLGEAFNIGSVFKKALSGKFIITLLVTFAIALVLGVIVLIFGFMFYLIPVLGSFITPLLMALISFAFEVAVMTWFGEAFRELEESQTAA